MIMTTLEQCKKFNEFVTETYLVTRLKENLEMSGYSIKFFTFGDREIRLDTDKNTDNTYTFKINSIREDTFQHVKQGYYVTKTDVYNLVDITTNDLSQGVKEVLPILSRMSNNYLKWEASA